MVFGSDLEPASGRRHLTLAATFFVVALGVSYAPDATQQRIATGLRGSVLRPFIGTQELLGELRAREAEADVLRGLVDSLSAELSATGGLVDENLELRALLGLARRVGPSFVPASVLRPGTAGSESLFFVDVGTADGVRVGAPVLSYRGLVGVIREVEAGRAVGIDWTSPDFRASAMVEGGLGYGLVETRRGTFRESDRLVLNGTAYNERYPEGALVLTSGLGGVLPRGIPIGRVAGVESEQGEWLRSYWLDPMVDAAGVTHALIMVDEGTPEGLAEAWGLDTLRAPRDGGGGDGTP